MSGASWGGSIVGNVAIKGSLDASLAANLPAGPATGDTYDISVAGSFEDDASIIPASAYFDPPDQIRWNGTNWVKMESGNNVSNTAFDNSWDGDVVNAPTKDAVYDVVNPIKTKSEQQDASNDIATQTYTILLTDHGKTLFFTFAGAITITLPASIGDTVHVTCVCVDAAGSLAFVDDATSTIVSKGSLFSVTDQYGVATAVHRGSNAWYLFGNLA